MAGRRVQMCLGTQALCLTCLVVLPCLLVPASGFTLLAQVEGGGSGRTNVKRVAVVTGANKGIGLEVARKLAAEPLMTVVLACRNAQLGAAAVDALTQAGYKNVVFQHLDLVNPASARALAEFVAREYGKLDILVNNAAVCFNDPTLYGKVVYTPFEKQAGITMKTNFFGTLSLTLVAFNPKP